MTQSNKNSNITRSRHNKQKNSEKKVKCNRYGRYIINTLRYTYFRSLYMQLIFYDTLSFIAVLNGV